LKLIIQPKDGVEPLIRGIDKARKSIEIAIFRFDRKEVEHALENAAKRGVLVHALIADTNRNGEKELRKLETRLLARGVTVARTSDDLVRYHGKMMIVDRKELYVLAFNFTRLDIDHSRSFGIITKNRQLVQEAVRLFESDTKRQPYTARCPKFLVSPVNARKRLSAFIKGARHELLIYDSKISDRALVRLLEQRAKAGVEVRIVGRVARNNSSFNVHKMPRMRLHTRSIIRDRHQVFLGSQSLRELELDARREVGVIVRDPKMINSLVKIFEEDWSATGASTTNGAKAEAGAQATEIAARTAEVVVKDFPSVAPVVEKAVRKVVGKTADAKLDHEEVEATVKDAVQKTIQEVVRDAVEQVAEEDHPDGKKNVPSAQK
jgi:phosphatidylserine/phosphatidylglycerophosphate/cardiolipin synthase-like enzyme